MGCGGGPGIDKDPRRAGSTCRMVSSEAPLQGDTLIGGHFCLRLPLLQIFLCLIREILCPCFPAKAETAPVYIIQVKTGYKTCRFGPLWMADPGARLAPVNWGVVTGHRMKGRPLRACACFLVGTRRRMWVAIAGGGRASGNLSEIIAGCEEIRKHLRPGPPPISKTTCPCFSGRSNIAKRYLSDSRRRTAFWSGPDSAFFRNVPSKKKGGEGNVVQPGLLRVRIFPGEYGDIWQGVLEKPLVAPCKVQKHRHLFSRPE